MATTIGKARMTHPVMQFPDAAKALHDLHEAVGDTLAPEITALVHLRASQINGCSVCVEMHSRDLKKTGAADNRIWSVAAWREAPYFTEAERAALALTEAATRIADRSDPVRDEVWEEAARHFDERQLGALALEIAGINVWNRLNVIAAQPSGQRW